MTISDQNVLKILMQSRGRIEAATWVVVRDTHATENIFQNVILKVMTKKEITFQAEEALLSWAFSLLAEKILTGYCGMARNQSVWIPRFWNC